jgi:putative transposase
MSSSLKRSLPRLPQEAYRGFASIFWTHSIEKRKTGWLTANFHSQFRELLCHLLSRYDCICSIYCLMPDHFHLLTTGVSAGADQLKFTRQLRKETNALIKPIKLQHQAHDHLLREEELERSAFQGVSFYIQKNPVRKGLCKEWEHYEFTGCMLPGYFGLDPRDENYWAVFWKIHNTLVTRNS